MKLPISVRNKQSCDMRLSEIHATYQQRWLKQNVPNYSYFNFIQNWNWAKNDPKHFEIEHENFWKQF